VTADLPQRDLGPMERTGLGGGMRDARHERRRQFAGVKAQSLPEREKSPPTAGTLASRRLQLEVAVDRLHAPFRGRRLAARAALGTLRRGLGVRRDLPHPPLLRLAAEPLPQFVRPRLDLRVMRRLLPIPLGTLQFDGDVGRLTQQTIWRFSLPTNPNKS